MNNPWCSWWHKRDKLSSTINTKDFKNADQQRIEILNPSQFVKKYISQDEIPKEM